MSITRLANGGFRLRREQLVRRPLDDVFGFFANARNLEAITPAFLKFKILGNPPAVIAAGTMIDYRLQLFGVPFKWRTEITEFVSGQYFVDVQSKGPYRQWHHRHEFRAVPEGTMMTDTVDYALPLGPLGMLAQGLFVGRTVQKIFDHRVDCIEKLLGPHDAKRAITAS